MSFARAGPMRAVLGLLLLAPHALGLSELPSFRATTGEAARKAAELIGAKWWAHVGDRVFTAPSAGDEVDLSPRVEDYYCAMGSESALTSVMKQRRVGGSGLWHIFHLPEGPAALNISQRGGRRASFSSLLQLRSEESLSTEFPVYHPSSCGGGEEDDEVVAGGGAAGGRGSLAAEKMAVSSLSAKSYLATLKEVIDIRNDDGTVTRAWGDPSGSANAHAYIKKQFAGMGLATCLQKFQASGTTQANVVAVIPGTKPDTLTVGAHFDSRPFSGSAPGAEDNGSGLAALLSIAKAYTDQKIKPEKTLYFVAFAGEEAGCLGSDHFAKQLQAGKAVPELCREDTGRSTSSFLSSSRRASAGGDSGVTHEAIALDEVGWLSPKYSKSTVNLESYDWAPEILDHLACASQRYNGDSLEIVHSNKPFGSDHMSWLQRGMKAALVINGDDEAYPNYHQSSDTLDNVTPGYANKIGKMVLGAVIRLAGSA